MKIVYIYIYNYNYKAIIREASQFSYICIYIYIGAQKRLKKCLGWNLGWGLGIIYCYTVIATFLIENKNFQNNSRSLLLFFQGAQAVKRTLSLKDCDLANVKYYNFYLMIQLRRRPVSVPVGGLDPLQVWHLILQTTNIRVNC